MHMKEINQINLLPYHHYYYFVDDIVMHEMFVPDFENVMIELVSVVVCRLNVKFADVMFVVQIDAFALDALDEDVVT